MQIIMYILMHIIMHKEEIIYGVVGVMHIHMAIVWRGLTAYIKQNIFYER